MRKKDNIELEPQAERVEKLFPCIGHSRAGHHKERRACPVAYSTLKIPNKSLIRAKLTSQLAAKKKDHVICVSEGKKSINHALSDTLNHYTEKAPDGEISPDRVKSWSVKERLLAAKRLKNMAQSDNKDKGCMQKITLIEKKKQNTKSERSNEELWQELLQKNQERHFHLTRITKFLLD